MVQESYKMMPSKQILFQKILKIHILRLRKIVKICSFGYQERNVKKEVNGRSEIRCQSAMCAYRICNLNTGTESVVRAATNGFFHLVAMEIDTWKFQ